MNLAFKSAASVDTIALPGAFGVGISLDCEDPTISPGIVPYVDESDMADALEIAVVEAKEVSGLWPFGSAQGDTLLPDDFGSGEPRGRPCGAAIGGNAFGAKHPLCEAGTIGIAFTQPTGGEVFFRARAMVVFSDLQRADFCSVAGLNSFAKRRKILLLRSPDLGTEALGLWAELRYCRLAIRKTPAKKSAT
jgi:hypothetical protein